MSNANINIIDEINMEEEIKTLKESRESYFGALNAAN